MKVLFTYPILILVTLTQANASSLELYLNGTMTKEQIGHEIFTADDVANELNEIEIDIKKAADSGVPLEKMIPLANHLNKEVISYNENVTREKMIARVTGAAIGMAIGYFGYRSSNSGTTMDFGITTIVNIAVTTLGTIAGYGIATGAAAIFMDDSVNGLDID